MTTYDKIEFLLDDLILLFRNNDSYVLSVEELEELISISDKIKKVSQEAIEVLELTD